MNSSSLLEAFDAVAHSEVVLSRLHAAMSELSRKQGLKDEKAWLSSAVDRLTAGREGLGDLLTRVMRLPELEPLREEHARTLQQTAVDAVERLQAGITFHGGSRAPLLETLYAKLKLPALRRADREDFEKFCSDFEKRLNGSYVKRMLGDDAFAPIAPAVQDVRTAFATWRGAFSPDALADTEATALRDELDAAARRLELPLRQARLLAEAACAPVKDLFESSGLAAKPKKRSLKPAVTEAVAAPEVESVAAEAEAAAEVLAEPAPAKKPRVRRAEKSQPAATE
jgi:hypothetical protein